VDKGLRNADQENMINDIQRRSMTSLLDNIIMPSLQKHLGKRNEERIKHLERSLNNSPIGLSRYPEKVKIEKVKIFNPQDPTTPLVQGSRRLKIHDKQISPSVSGLSKKRGEEVLKKLRKADPELN
jgi:hypothetical protein